MGFYLLVEVDSPLPPEEFQRRVIAPIAGALEPEKIGRILVEEAGYEPGPAGTYQVALEVVDQERAWAVVEGVLQSVDGGDVSANSR